MGEGQVTQGKVCAWESPHGVKRCRKWRYPPDGRFPRYSEHGLLDATGWLTVGRGVAILALVEVGAFSGAANLIWRIPVHVATKVYCASCTYSRWL